MSDEYEEVTDYKKIILLAVPIIAGIVLFFTFTGFVELEFDTDIVLIEPKPSAYPQDEPTEESQKPQPRGPSEAVEEPFELVDGNIYFRDDQNERLAKKYVDFGLEVSDVVEILLDNCLNYTNGTAPLKFQEEKFTGIVEDKQLMCNL